MDYGPYGEPLSSAVGLSSRAYAGLFRDSEAGLDHAQARSYQVRTGRFTTLDPIYAGLFDPQAWTDTPTLSIARLC
jgi:RHS repeat-associated protein